MTATLDRRDAEARAARLPTLAGRSRPPQLPVAMVALLVAAVSALGFGVWARSIAAREPVLVLARDLPAGAAIGDDDLAVAEVAADASVRAVRADAVDRVVGRIVTASLPKGALLHPDHVADAPVLAASLSVVGVKVALGEGPLTKLESGLKVMVVWTPSAASADEAPRVVLDDAVIDSVETAPTEAGGTAGVQYVALRVPTRVAPEIAAGATTNQIRLVLVGA